MRTWINRGGLGLSSTVTPPPGTFTTNFPATENPISQGGIWVRGLTEGLDWTNPETTPGKCFATQSPTPSRYSDDIAILKSSFQAFNPNQYAQATAFKQAGYTGGGGNHEIELELRFSINANNAHGYEILWGITGYLAVVRWNGAVGDYTPIYDPGIGSVPTYNDGDVLRAQIVGNIITVAINGTTVPNFASIDVSSIGGTVWSTGQPGLGFWPVDGATTSAAGWKSYTAGNL